MESEAFSKCLKYVLLVINFINESNHKEQIQAFSLVETLPQVSQMKSTVRPNFTLLNVVTDTIQKREPELFYDLGLLDLSGASVIPISSDPLRGSNVGKSSRRGKDVFAGLTSPVKLMNIMFQDAKTCLERIKKSTSKENEAELNFVSKAEDVLERECHEQLGKLKNQVDKLNQIYDNLLRNLAQEKTTDPGLLFYTVTKFLRELAQVRQVLPQASSQSHKLSKQMLIGQLKNQLSQKTLDEE